jgi:hypothetical protein
VAKGSVRTDIVAGDNDVRLKTVEGDNGIPPIAAEA